MILTKRWRRNEQLVGTALPCRGERRQTVKHRRPRMRSEAVMAFRLRTHLINAACINRRLL